MQILRLFILSCSHIALSLRQVKSTNRPRPAGFSQKFSARFRKGHPLPCKLARGVRQAFGGSQNLPRQVRHVFGGSQNLPRGVRHVFVGSQKLPRQLRHVFGGSQKQRAGCGTFSGVPETSAECAAHFRGSRKPARSVRHVFGGPGNQRGLCGTFSGVPEISADSAAHLRGSRKSARSVRQTYKTFVFRFALLSACITLDKLGGASDEQT